MSTRKDKGTIRHLGNKVRHLTKEEEKVAVIRREEVVLAHIIIPIQITDNRTNIIVNTQLVEDLTSTKKVLV